MIQNYKIVERLKAGRTHSSLGIQTAPSALEIEAASLIQELVEALEMARYDLTRTGFTDKGVAYIDAALSKLKEA